MAERRTDEQADRDAPTTDTPSPGSGVRKDKSKDTEGPMGDAQLTDEAAKDPDIDRSKTPGQAYDV